MEEEPPDAKNLPQPPPKPVIPPPDLSRPAPPPPSPLESIPRSTNPPPLSTPGNVGAKVNLRTDGRDDDGPPAGGIAPFNTRVIAVIIDWVVAFGVILGLTFILPGFADRLAYLVGLAYLVTRDSLPFLGGQSVGKKAMKIQTVTLDGKSLVGNWEAALIRNGVLIIPLFPLVELFILLTREDKPERGRRLGDEWAKTKVIIEEKPEPVDSDDSVPPPPAGPIT
jgi:uncharacterized RDD family membrane protein YckC